MNEINTIGQQIANQQFSEASFLSVFMSMILCMLLVSLVSWFYKKYSRSLGGKSHVGNVLPLIGLVVFLVITVVKSSLALSLGLVGALSIVRFRTPIKEPEELGYLFLTIAIGLGFGAGFEIVTLTVTVSILIYILLTTRHKIKNGSGISGEYTVVIKHKPDLIPDIENLFKENVISAKVVRLESVNNLITTYYNVSLFDRFNISSLLNEVSNLNSDISVDLIEAGVNW